MTPADDKRGPVGQAAILFELHYPERLRASEYKAIWQRRGKTANAAKEPVPEPTNRIGLALSGGGIRSATFCLGVLQALAGRGLLGSIDYLSTVSGGGYIGSFLGRLFTRSWVKDRDPNALADINPQEATKPSPEENDRWLKPVADALEDPPGVRRVEHVLDDHRSAPMQWLRESGRYLSPTGGADTLIDVAVALRNWAAVTVVMLVTLLSVFLSIGTVRAALWTREFWRINVEAPLILRTDHHWWWSPALIVPVVFFCLFTLPLGWAYWLTQRKRSTKKAQANRREPSPPHPILAVIVVILAAAAATWTLGGHGERMLASLAAALTISGVCTVIWFWAFDCQKLNAEQVRNRLSRVLAQSLLWTVVLFVLTLVDSFGQMAWAMLRLENGPGLKSFVGVTGLIVVFSLAKRIKLLLDELPDRKATQIPLSLLAGIAAVVLGGGVLIGLSAVTHGLVWQWKNPSIRLTQAEVEKLCLTTNNPCCSNLMVLSPTNYFLPGTNLVAQWNGPKVKLNKDSMIEVA
ncbi:MAG TPA: hypothetical protein VFI05_07650, partial [Nitrospiraceae bacterium]|nr:hypothetical protein [Nitrospiraceae bacterium]